MEKKTALFEKERRGMRAVDLFSAANTDIAMQVLCRVIDWANGERAWKWRREKDIERRTDKQRADPIEING